MMHKMTICIARMSWARKVPPTRRPANLYGNLPSFFSLSSHHHQNLAFSQSTMSTITSSASLHKPPAPPVLHSFPTTDDLIDSLAKFVVHAQNESIEKRGKFTVALSGGSLPKQLKGLIGRNDVKWDLWYAAHVHLP